MVFPIEYFCEKCNEEYTDIENRWCKPCFINELRLNTSGNEIIDNFIQEMQSEIDVYDDIVFEWIPYNQFNDIGKTSQGELTKLCSAIWKDGPLCYDPYKFEYIRKQNKKV